MILTGNLDNVHDALYAEVHACLIAITVAADQGMMQIQLESDSMVLVKALKSPDYDLSAGGTLFREAKFLLDTQFISFDVNYVPRSCNVCAHELARCDLLWDPDQSYVWVDPLPEFVIFLAVRDLHDPPET